MYVVPSCRILSDQYMTIHSSELVRTRSECPALCNCTRLSGTNDFIISVEGKNAAVAAGLDQTLFRPYLERKSVEPEAHYNIQKYLVRTVYDDYSISHTSFVKYPN